MNKQRKVLITITYNEMGIIIDTKAEEVAQPVAKDINVPCTDTISRQAAIDAHCELCAGRGRCSDICPDMEVFKLLPSAQPETLNGKEQMIFLAAMSKEEKVCEEVDRNYVR